MRVRILNLNCQLSNTSFEKKQLFSFVYILLDHNVYNLLTLYNVSLTQMCTRQGVKNVYFIVLMYIS